MTSIASLGSAPSSQTNTVSFSGARGGSVNASYTEQANHLSGEATLTSANGATLQASAAATYVPGQSSGSLQLSGANGTNANVAVNQSDGTLQIDASVFGAFGASGAGAGHSASVTVANGAIDVTTGTGKSFHFVA